MITAPFPSIEFDEIEANSFEATTGNSGGLGTVTFNLNLAGDRVVLLAFVPDVDGFAISGGPNFTTIYGNTNSIAMVTALTSILEQNGKVIIAFSGTPEGTISFA